MNGAGIYSTLSVKQSIPILVYLPILTKLIAEASLLSLAGIFFYLTNDDKHIKRLVDEIRGHFHSAEDIVYRLKLLRCTYLQVCIDEGMRLTPSGACEFSREVL